MVLAGKPSLPKRGSMSHPFTASGGSGNMKLNFSKALSSRDPKSEVSPRPSASPAARYTPQHSSDLSHPNSSFEPFVRTADPDVYSTFKAEKEEICRDDDLASVPSSRGPSVLPVGRQSSAMLIDIENMLRLSSLAANEGDENFRKIRSLLMSFENEKQPLSDRTFEQGHSNDEKCSSSRDVSSSRPPTVDENKALDSEAEVCPEATFGDATRWISEVATVADVFRSATLLGDEPQGSSTPLGPDREQSVSPPIDAGDL